VPQALNKTCVHRRPGRLALRRLPPAAAGAAEAAAAAPLPVARLEASVSKIDQEIELLDEDLTDRAHAWLASQPWYKRIWTRFKSWRFKRSLTRSEWRA
jgi:hypothetical protein